jgi:hypothetical protein
MMNFFFHNVPCPACRTPIDIFPSQSLVSEKLGLAHRCPVCRGWLATYVRQIGSWLYPELRPIECRVATDHWWLSRQGMIE